MKGATTRPATPVARRPSTSTCSTRTEVSTRAPPRSAAGTYEMSIDCFARERQPVKHSPLPRQPRTLREIGSDEMPSASQPSRKSRLRRP